MRRKKGERKKERNKKANHIERVGCLRDKSHQVEEEETSGDGINKNKKKKKRRRWKSILFKFLYSLRKLKH